MSGQRTGEDGMVTAELAIGSLLTVVVGFVLVWMVTVAGLQVRCHDAAAEIARQAARGDASAVAAATEDAPEGAVVTTRREGRKVEVVVEVEAGRWVGWLPSVPLRAVAVVLAEE